MSLTSDNQSISSPVKVSEDVWGFQASMDGKSWTSWWIGSGSEPLLIDCPGTDAKTIGCLKSLAENKKPRILLTNREAHGRVEFLYSELGWPIIVQEQEAYLLPGLQNKITFSEELEISSGIRVLWTPGPTPGSCVALVPKPWNVLFCGRLLVPVTVDKLSGLKTEKTFHWPMQVQSLKKLQSWVPLDLLPQLASGVSLGLLGGIRLLDWEAWEKS